MEVNVAQLLKEPVGAERRYHLEVEQGDTRYMEGVYRATGEVRLLRLTESIMVTGKIEALVEMSCVRCLEGFPQAVSFDLQDEYYPSIDISSGANVPAPDDPNVFVIGSDHVLSLGEALRQYTILALPMKPVCRQDCRGLCPQCGTNLNLETCKCITQTLDQRLAALADLKMKLK